MSNCMPINQITEEMEKKFQKFKEARFRHTLTKEPMLRIERAQEEVNFTMESV